MTLIIILNAVFSAFVLLGIVGMHLYAIAKDHSEQVRTAPIPATAHRPTTEAARQSTGRRGHVVRPGVGAVRVRGASSQALS